MHILLYYTPLRNTNKNSKSTRMSMVRTCPNLHSHMLVRSVVPTSSLSCAEPSHSEQPILLMTSPTLSESDQKRGCDESTGHAHHFVRP
mmetsp:Transcript_873/g.2492  ORF Transcript_873/g.2492 Transcript_873/m.2492 type:complete len:89 (-) Transcript_873:571-837(-)